MIMQNKTIEKCIRTYALAGLAAVTLAMPSYAQINNDSYARTNQVYELPIESSTREEMSNSSARIRYDAEQRAKAKEIVARKEISGLFTNYTNFLAQARRTFNDSLKDGKLDVSEQKKVLEFYSEATKVSEKAQVIARQNYLTSHEVFSPTKEDKNLEGNLSENINKYNKDAATAIENSLKAQQLNATVESNRRHAAPFIFFPWWIYWFNRRRD